MSNDTPTDGKDRTQTSVETRRVFLRAETGDEIKIVKIRDRIDEYEIPDTLRVVQRQETYFGPKLRVEDQASSEQFELTAPAQDVEGMMWRIEDMEWVRTGEVVVEFSGDLPQYDICLRCGDPIKTAEHETASFLGTCNN